jgi:hypothetical protein
VNTDPRLLALHVAALLELGRAADARPSIQTLWQSGYRDRELLMLLSREHIDYPANPDFDARLQAALHTENL